MKCLISATISPAAYTIYESWPKQKKSATINDMIIKNNVIHKMCKDMQDGLKERNEAISRVIWELKDNKIHKTLCTDLNKLLLGSLHYQYSLEDT